MSTPASLDTAALNLMLGELRLPTIKALWPQFTAQADCEGWPAARLLAEHGYRVLFARTTDLAQRLQAARRELALEAAISKLDKFHLLVLDDFSYVNKDQAETSVLFELISARYEHRSMLITANQPFGDWQSIFPDPAMTVAAIDRLVHRATIFELNVESYRRRTAIDNKRKQQRSAAADAATADQTAAAPPEPVT